MHAPVLVAFAFALAPPFADAKRGHSALHGAGVHSGGHHETSRGGNVGSHPHAGVSMNSPDAAHNPAHEYHQAPGGNSSSGKHKSTYAQGVERDDHGKIKRSEKAKDDFKGQHPCPSTGKSSGSCPGYVIDHIKPLKKGGKDGPFNMQWQTQSAAKAKDRWE